MEITAEQIAQLIDGEVVGKKEVCVTKFAKIEEADSESLTFLGNEKYAQFLSDCKAAIILMNKELHETYKDQFPGTFILVKNPYQSIGTLLNYYEQLQEEKSGREEPHYLASSAKVGDNCYIGAFSYIGNSVEIGDNVKIYPHAYIGDKVKIGDGTILYSGVKIYKDCNIGQSCVVHANSVIGSDGFGFTVDEKGEYNKVSQIGNVDIGDFVEIGAACTIDRATMGSTRIEHGVKLDNQIQIAHNVVVGANTVIASQSGIAGSTKIGENNIIGGQVGIVGHIHTGKNVQIQAQSGVNANVADGAKLYGSPALDAMDFRKSYIYFRKLPQLIKRLEDLEKKTSSTNKLLET
ncbi:MAG: UDP-3-O-(3-hydroxymyristoyl)glucosamine N-acyltransferase [Weeksellaceae bacterium]|nr:UDP-3-O-(3-hydroxymyristoyl)glucosamine N-acyltransferase [Weeksellaceae bacterium]